MSKQKRASGNAMKNCSSSGTVRPIGLRLSMFSISNRSPSLRHLLTVKIVSGCATIWNPWLAKRLSRRNMPDSSSRANLLGEWMDTNRNCLRSSSEMASTRGRSSTARSADNSTISRLCRRTISKADRKSPRAIAPVEKPIGRTRISRTLSLDRSVRRGS